MAQFLFRQYFASRRDDSTLDSPMHLTVDLLAQIPPVACPGASMKSSESFNATSSTAIPFLTASHLILPYLTRHHNCPSISLEVYGPAVKFQASMLGDYAFRVAESGT